MKNKRHFSSAVRLIPAASALALRLIALLAAIGVLSAYVPYFYTAVRLTSLVCILMIVLGGSSAEYKLPWVLTVISLPVLGTVLYATFYSRIFPLSYLKRMERAERCLPRCCSADSACAGQERLLCEHTGAVAYSDTEIRYFPSGREGVRALFSDLRKAEKYILLEYYLIGSGALFDELTAILAERSAAGVEVTVIYDALGSLGRLSRSDIRTLKELGIFTVAFSPISGRLDCGANNRNHRKIAVVDGTVAYTGGINLADEYIGLTRPYGAWKDACVRLCGNGARALQAIVLHDLTLSTDSPPRLPICDRPTAGGTHRGTVIPFADAPRPFRHHGAAKSLIASMISTAQRSVYITTPYLAADSELIYVIENAARRGVEVNIVIPSVPDKRWVYLVSKVYARELIKSGVHIYLYPDGFIHSKIYLADEKYALVGTMNLDYRSLAHNFECGVWTREPECVAQITRDARATLLRSHRTDVNGIFSSRAERLAATLLRIFSPLL